MKPTCMHCNRRVSQYPIPWYEIQLLPYSQRTNLPYENGTHVHKCTQFY